MSTTTTTTTSIHRPTASKTSSLRQSALKKNMSITQTYYLAHKARAKLSREAAQPDHDLRLLVGHANLLDSLMLELADAEREQERWFNQSVRGATNAQQERRVQWADNIVEEEDEDDYDSDSSDSDDYDSEDDDIEMANTSLPVKPMSPRITHIELDEDMEEDDLEEDYAQLELVRTPSHSNSPPELVDHDSDSSDDDSMPPSPPQSILAFDEKDVKEQSQQEQESNSLYDEEYYLPPRNPARLVSAISVY
ncbi:hypothetical protein FPCIR_13165 [Fusarium pseudocircinatum]|uniref:Protein ECM13 n=1 Tax=Fusarium pseudocircinatum TaxID=56676 RepID=A0A8H5KME1_9HYPO|nr:hypothetical protein FPCIR_13165 [Fusarium pseudocircinatum]